MQDISQLTTDELSLMLDEVDKELLKIKDNINIVAISKHHKERKVFELAESIRMARHVHSKMILEKDMIERAYWRNKKG